jgi:hypothetical protein
MHPCCAGFLGLRSGVNEVCVLKGHAAASMGNWFLTFPYYVVLKRLERISQGRGIISQNDNLGLSVPTKNEGR